jgi:hypothetical protein
VDWSAHRILEVTASKPVSVFDDVLLMQVTAKRLLLSKQTIPHYYLSLDTHVDKLLKYVLSLNPVFHGRSNCQCVIVQTFEHIASPISRHIIRPVGSFFLFFAS